MIRATTLCGVRNVRHAALSAPRNINVNAVWVAWIGRALRLAVAVNPLDFQRLFHGLNPRIVSIVGNVPSKQIARSSSVISADGLNHGHSSSS